MGLFSYFREQRERERETFITIIKEVMTQADRQTSLVIEQTKLLQRLADFFDFSGTPQPRVMNDQRELEIQQAREKANDELDLS